MPKRSTKSGIIITEEQRINLIGISQSRTGSLREIQRAKIILKYLDKKEIKTISEEVHVSRPTVYKCLEKAVTMGADAALKDYYHSPKQAVITEEAKLWVINTACCKPKDYGYAAEIWSRRLPAEHVGKNAVEEGHPSLAKANKAAVHRILDGHPVRPHKVSYYLERRDPEFEKKMNEILLICKEVQTAGHLSPETVPEKIRSVSADEKPGVQAIKNIAPDILPNPEKNSRIMRDYEYKRPGTVSIMAALDLHDGHVIAQVHDRHRSCEFISLLKEIDEYYPADDRIRLILDNHSSHVSKETRAYLETRPNRFVYTHTPALSRWVLANSDQFFNQKKER